MFFLASIISWLVFGTLVGWCAKVILKERLNYLSTFLVGISGSFIGGIIEWFMHFGNATFIPAGFVMSVIGSVVFCSLWGWYNVKKTGT